MSFEQALGLLREGRSVRREVWETLPGKRWLGPVNIPGAGLGSIQLCVNQARSTVRHPWTPTLSEILAEDWEVVE